MDFFFKKRSKIIPQYTLSFQGAKSMPLNNLCEVKRSCVSPEIGRTWVFLIRKVLHWRQKWLPKGHFQCYLKRVLRATNTISFSIFKQEIWREIWINTSNNLSVSWKVKSWPLLFTTKQLGVRRHHLQVNYYYVLFIWLTEIFSFRYLANCILPSFYLSCAHGMSIFFYRRIVL